MPQSEPATHRSARDLYLLSIAIFKLVKAVTLTALGIGVLSILHKDISRIIAQRAAQVGLDPQSYEIQRFIQKIGLFSDNDVTWISIATFAYAALFLTEGLGLLFERPWAEWITVISTTSFIPWEVYEIIKMVSWIKIIFLIANIGIVIYLIYKIRKRRGEEAAPDSPG